MLGFESVCWASIGVQCAGLQLECSVLASIGVQCTGRQLEIMLGFENVSWASIGVRAGVSWSVWLGLVNSHKYLYCLEGRCMYSTTPGCYIVHACTRPYVIMDVLYSVCTWAWDRGQWLNL